VSEIRGVKVISGATLRAAASGDTGDDNVADAAACLLIALEQHARGLAAAPDHPAST